MPTSFTVEASIVARDEASGILGQVQSRIAQLETDATALGERFQAGQISSEAFATSLQGIAKEADQLDKSLGEVVGVKNFSKQTQDAQRDLQGLQKSLRDTSKAAATSAGGFKVFVAALRQHALAIGAIIGTMVVAFRKLGKAARLAGTTRALEIQLGRQGLALDRFLETLKKTSRGQVSQADLIAKSARAILLGIPAKELNNLLNIARVQAIGSSRDTTQAFDDITRGIARMSPFILDNIGIQLALGDAYQRMADQSGIAVENLSKEAKQRALINLVIEKTAANVRDLGDAQSESAAAAEQLAANTEDITNALALALVKNKDLSGAFSEFTKLMVNASPNIAKVFNVFVRGSVAAAKVATFFYSTAGKAIGELINLYERLLGAQKPIEVSSKALEEAAKRQGITVEELNLKIEKAVKATREQGVANREAAEAALAAAETAAEYAEAQDKVATKTEEAAETASEYAAAQASVATATRMTVGEIRQAANEAARLATGFKSIEEVTNVLGETTSTELTQQVIETTLYLEQMRVKLDENSHEYQRLREIGEASIESLLRRIQSLRDGLGDVDPVAKKATRALGELDTEIGSVDASAREARGGLATMERAFVRAGQAADTAGRRVAQFNLQGQRTGSRLSSGAQSRRPTLSGGTFTTVTLSQPTVLPNGEVIWLLPGQRVTFAQEQV